MRKKNEFAHSGVKLVQNSYEFHTNFCIHTLAEHIRSYGIHTKFTLISPHFVTLCTGTVQSYGTILPIPQRFLHTQWAVVTGLGPRSHSIW